MIEFPCKNPDGCTRILRYTKHVSAPARMRKRCGCGFWNEITPAMLANCTIPGSLSEIARVANPLPVATSPAPSTTLGGPSHKACNGGKLHSINTSKNSQKSSQSALATSPPEQSASHDDAAGTSCTSGDAISPDAYRDLLLGKLKQPIPYLQDKALEKFKVKHFKVSEHDLISFLTNIKDMRNHVLGRLPTQKEATEIMLYGGKGNDKLVDYTYLSRLVKKWEDRTLIFKRGHQLVANRDYFDWGEYHPAEPKTIPLVQASEHCQILWLVPKDYRSEYNSFYQNIPSKKIGAPNCGEKPFTSAELKLFGINKMGAKDYKVYAYPHRGIKCKVFVDDYVLKDELEHRQATYRRTIQWLVEDKVREIGGKTICFEQQLGKSPPHTTIPSDVDVKLPLPAGGSVTLEAEGPNGSHPHQAETSDKDGPVGVDYTNKLANGINQHEIAINQMRQDFNAIMDVMTKIPAVIKEIAEGQALAVTATKATNDRINDELAGVNNSIAQLANQVGSLVQLLSHQYGEGAGFG